MISSLAVLAVVTIAGIATLSYWLTEFVPTARGVACFAPAAFGGAAYRLAGQFRDSTWIRQSLRAVTLFVAFPLLVYLVVPGVRTAESTILILAINGPLLALIAAVVHYRAWTRARDPILGDRILILGMSPLALRVAKEIRRKSRNGLVKLALLDAEASPGEAVVRSGVAVIGSASDLPSILESFRPTGIVVALGERRNQLPTKQLLDCRARGIRIESGIQAYERLTGKFAIESLTPGDLLFSQRLTPSRMVQWVARAVSFALALVGAVVAAPIALVIAVLIKLTSEGPVFFVQERIGCRGTTFRLVKFRTMFVEKNTTSEWARDNFDRITGIGHWLRDLRLDEIPQLWNIIRGDMNFVGPRPHPVSNHELFDREIPYYMLRAMIRPGLTGWAQIRNGYANDLDGEIEKMRFDLYYIAHQSLWFDLRIILNTLKFLVVNPDLESQRDPAPVSKLPVAPPSHSFPPVPAPPAVARGAWPRPVVRDRAA